MESWRKVCRVACHGFGCWAFVCAAVAGTRPVGEPVALSPYARAAQDREAFEAGDNRQKADFTRVMDEFRAVYHDNPRDAHAPDAIYAVAELLAEQGRTLGDMRSSHAALGQYEFLRTQYPGSSLRVRALLEEGNVQGDLGDVALARERYRDAIREAPRSSVAAEAREKLAGLHGSAFTPEAKIDTESAAIPGEKAEPAPVEPPPNAPPNAPSNAPSKKTNAVVTGIRHWSTPTYTRVAIDLGDEVTFEAARVAHPDRIYFDLHGARLAGELVGRVSMLPMMAFSRASGQRNRQVM